MSIAKKVTDQEFELFRKFLYKKAGIYLRDTKQMLVSNRLRKRLKELELQSFTEYYRFITRDPRGAEEITCFIDAITTNETYFFRNPKQFSFLNAKIIPEIMRIKEQGFLKTIRVWSAGCSTGEEPYSIAMSLMETVKDNKWNIHILATDISNDVVARAKKAEYGEYALQRTAGDIAKKYFDHNKTLSTYSLKPEIKKLVRFYVHNMMDELEYGNFDIIFCRNVLIYFDSDSKARVLANLTPKLCKSGYLIVGHSETLINANQSYKYLQPSIYRKVS